MWHDKYDTHAAYVRAKWGWEPDWGSLRFGRWTTPSKEKNLKNRNFLNGIIELFWWIKSKSLSELGKSVVNIGSEQLFGTEFNYCSMVLALCFRLCLLFALFSCVPNSMTLFQALGECQCPENHIWEVDLSPLTSLCYLRHNGTNIARWPQVRI